MFIFSFISYSGRNVLSFSYAADGVSFFFLSFSLLILKKDNQSSYITGFLEEIKVLLCITCLAQCLAVGDTLYIHPGLFLFIPPRSRQVPVKLGQDVGIVPHPYVMAEFSLQVCSDGVGLGAEHPVQFPDPSRLLHRAPLIR